MTEMIFFKNNLKWVCCQYVSCENRNVLKTVTFLRKFLVRGNRSEKLNELIGRNFVKVGEKVEEIVGLKEQFKISQKISHLLGVIDILILKQILLF